MANNQKARGSMQYKTAKNIPVHLDLTGEIDKIVCKCGGFQNLPVSASRAFRHKWINEFYAQHQGCKRLL